jgi:hypothetical protein
MQAGAFTLLQMFISSRSKSVQKNLRRTASSLTKLSRNLKQLKHVLRPMLVTAIGRDLKFAPLSMTQVNMIISFPRALVLTHTIFAVCETIYNEGQVDDDVPECLTKTENICSRNEATEKEECRDVTKQVCTVNQETNTKMSKQTDCSKRPRKVCGADVCPLTRGENVCSQEVKKV